MDHLTGPGIGAFSQTEDSAIPLVHPELKVSDPVLFLDGNIGYVRFYHFIKADVWNFVVIHEEGHKQRPCWPYEDNDFFKTLDP